MSASTQVQQMYLAYYGRPADVQGLDYWTSKLVENDSDMSSIIQAFGRSQESQNLYSDLDTRDMIRLIYLRLFDREPDSQGLAWWANEIDSGNVSLIDASARIFYGAQPGTQDHALLQMRVEACHDFTQRLRDDSKLAEWYQGSEPASVVSAWIQRIDDAEDIGSPLFRFPITAQASVKLFPDHGDNWLGDFFMIDLNQDGIDEIILAGRKSQSSPWPDWQESLIQVLGWNTGEFATETELWLQNNKILGTEPSVKFGDFNGDGWQDIWIAPSTDMKLYGPGVILINEKGQSLTRHDIDIGDIWAHDSAVADLDRDGRDDIVIASFGPEQTVIMGQAQGFEVKTSTLDVYAAGLAAGDFLQDGTMQFVTTDSDIRPDRDTLLHNLDITGTSIDFREISQLPSERFYLDQWRDHADMINFDQQRPHSVRATTFDFNRDGLPDVLISTSANNARNDWHSYFELQFLQNLGQGRFRDVTASTLKDFDMVSNVSYAPRLIDVNGDGLMDIWLSAQDYNGGENSNRALIAHQDGTYHEAFTQDLTDLRLELGGHPSPINVVRTPDGDLDLISLAWGPDSVWATVNLVAVDPNFFSFP